MSTVKATVNAVIGDPAKCTNLPVWEGLKSSELAALGSLALLFTYVMSGTASVCVWSALFAIVILVMWRTSSWIGVDGLFAAYRERHSNMFTFRLHGARDGVGDRGRSPGGLVGPGGSGRAVRFRSPAPTGATRTQRAAPTFACQITRDSGGKRDPVTDCNC
jgi:hypothetical protein